MITVLQAQTVNDDQQPQDLDVLGREVLGAAKDIALRAAFTAELVELDGGAKGDEPH